MSMLATPDTITGPLTAADLDAARKHSTGRIFPAGLDQQGRHQTRSLGREPWHDTVPSGSVLSMRRHNRTRATVGLAIALAVVGYCVRLAWPLLGA